MAPLPAISSAISSREVKQQHCISARRRSRSTCAVFDGDAAHARQLLPIDTNAPPKEGGFHCDNDDLVQARDMVEKARATSAMAPSPPAAKYRTASLR